MSITLTLPSLLASLCIVFNAVLLTAAVVGIKSSYRENGKVEWGPTILATLPLILSITISALYIADIR